MRVQETNNQKSQIPIAVRPLLLCVKILFCEQRRSRPAACCPTLSILRLLGAAPAFGCSDCSRHRAAPSCSSSLDIAMLSSRDRSSQECRPEERLDADRKTITRATIGRKARADRREMAFDAVLVAILSFFFESCPPRAVVDLIPFSVCAGRCKGHSALQESSFL